MTKESIETTTPKFLRWALLALILLFVACQVVEVRFARTCRGDETLYIQNAYTMIESGDWLTPHFESGELRFNKPILTYWVVGIPMRIFGLSFSAARLPSVALALAALPFVYALTRLLVRNGTAALLAVAAYLTTETVYSNAHQARTDSLLAFCVIGAMYFFARLIFEPGHERRDALLAYVFTALALITKGMVGIVFILLPVGVFVAMSWRRAGRARWRALMSPWGWAALLIITVPWYAIMLAKYKHVFTDMFLDDQVTENVRGGKSYVLINIFNYLWLLVKDCLPWSVPAVLAIATNDGGIRATFKERRAEWLFLLTWLGVTYFVLLFGNVARDRYLLPALPTMAVLAGLAAAKAGAADARPRGFKWGLYVVALGALLMGLACEGHVAACRVIGSPADAMELVAGLALIAGAVVMFRRTRAGQALEAALCGGGILVVAMLSVSAFFIAPAPMEPAAEIARETIRSLPEQTQIATVGLSKHVRAAMLLNSGRKATEWVESEKGDSEAKKLADQAQFLCGFLEEPGEKVVLLDARDYAALPAGLRERFTVITAKSGTEERDFPKWVRSRPRSLADLIRGTQQELYLLHANGGTPLTAP